MKACVSFESNFSPSSYIGMVRDPSFKDFMRARQTIQNLKRDSLRPRHEKKQIANSLGPVEYGGQRAGRIPPYPRTLLSPQIRPPNFEAFFGNLSCLQQWKPHRRQPASCYLQTNCLDTWKLGRVYSTKKLRVVMLFLWFIQHPWNADLRYLSRIVCASRGVGFSRKDAYGPRACALESSSVCKQVLISRRT